MKPIHALVACLLISTSLAGCFGDDDEIISACTDSDAVNYNPDADEDDGSCVMPAAQTELESAALTQITDIDERRSGGETYGVKMVMETDSTIEGDSISTEVTIIEIYDSEDQSISYTYKYKLNGMDYGDYQVRQKGDVINVYSEDEWYLVNDEIGDSNNLLNAAIKKGNGDDISMDPYFTCDEEEYDIPMDWVNDGLVHCQDGTDEGVTQEEIDAILADGRQKTLFPDDLDIAELDWTMTVEDGYQTISASNEEGIMYINFDENLQMVNFIVEAVDSEGLGAEFENTVSSISILDDDEITVEVSDDYPPAASPLLVETNYQASKYIWNCELSYNIPANQVVSEDEINSSIDSTPIVVLPEWCGDKYPSSDMIHTFTDDVEDDYFWNNGFSTTKRIGSYAPSGSPIFHTLRIVDDALITTSLNVSEHISLFFCDEGTTTISFAAINDGVADCTSGIDEDTQSDNDYLQCTNLGYETIAVYVESTDSCETTTNLSQVMMDDEYLYFVLSETLEMWDGWDKESGTEFWFKRSQAYGEDESQSIVAEASNCNYCTYNGMSPYSFIIEDEMNFQNHIDEFRLDLGFAEYNDNGEEEFTLHVSFDLSQMQSGETTDAMGNNWVFDYYDMNGNNYLDAGDTIVVYTDYEDGDERPTVKLYHDWGGGYTDESPALLPGLTMFSTLSVLLVAVLCRRVE
jgi:hypothetical protein